MNIEYRVFERPDFEPFTFNNSKEVYDYLSKYSKADREMFIILFLDAKNNIIKEEINSMGTIDTSVVYPREVFRAAILNNASSIIIAHNHPSGDPKPSEPDKKITKEILFASEVMQIKTLDHIVIGRDKYFSFADEGLLDGYESLAKVFMSVGHQKGKN